MLLSAQSTAPPAAAALKDPAGQSVRFRLQTLGPSYQIYTCKAANGGFAWTGPDPDAVLATEDRSLIVHHYKGPAWEAQDGSVVRSEGKLAKHFLAPRADAIHWLELPAEHGRGQFADLTFIHRIDTSGGVPPSGKPCDASNAGAEERVRYSATYLFYAPSQTAH